MLTRFSIYYRKATNRFKCSSRTTSRKCKTRCRGPEFKNKAPKRYFEYEILLHCISKLIHFIDEEGRRNLQSEESDNELLKVVVIGDSRASQFTVCTKLWEQIGMEIIGARST